MKLSFGLKAKPRAKPQLFQGSDDDEEETGPANKRQRVEASPGLLHIWLLLPFQTCSHPLANLHHEVGCSVISEVPAAPSDPEVHKVAEKLAEFVAKNGRSFEGVTKQRNPGNTPFK